MKLYFKKSIITIVLAGMLSSISLTGCTTQSSNNIITGDHYFCPSPTQKAVDIGKKGLLIAEKYILGDKDYLEAYKEISNLCDNDLSYVEEYDDEDREKNQTHYSDFNIRSALIYLSASILEDGDSPKSYDKIISCYNDLADFLGEPNL